MILRRHLLRLLATRVFAALVVLVAILELLDLLEVTTDILQRKLGLGGVLYYAVLRLPSLIEQAAPLALLAGCLFAFVQLARENAVVALRSTGISAYQLLAMIAPVAATVAALHLASVHWISPRADQALDAWWSRTTPRAAAAPSGPRSFRVGKDVVVASQGDARGTRLTGLTIYRRNAAGALTERLQADEATYAGGAWRLTKATFQALTPSGVQRGEAAQMSWSGPPPQDVRTVFAPEEAVAPGSATRALAGGVAEHPPAFYRTTVQRSWSAPLAAFVMLLLASPVLLINVRAGAARTVVFCLAAGLAYVVVEGIFTALGQGGDVPAALAAWSAPAIFAAAGASALLYMEG